MTPRLKLREWINVPSFALVCGIVGAISGLVLCGFNLALKWIPVGAGSAQPDQSDTLGRLLTSFGFSAIVGFVFGALAGMAAFLLLRSLVDLGLPLLSISLVLALTGGAFAVATVYLMYLIGVINVSGFPVHEMIVVGISALLGSMTLGRVATTRVELARAA